MSVDRRLLEDASLRLLEDSDVRLLETSSPGGSGSSGITGSPYRGTAIARERQQRRMNRIPISREGWPNWSP